MRRLSRTAALTCAATFLVMLATPAAKADTTYRHDDGTREAAVLVDATDGEDQARTGFLLDHGAARGSTGMTLWIYGKAYGCDVPGNGHQVWLMGSYLIGSYDPCAVFPTTAYGWHGLAISPSRIAGFNPISIVIEDADSAPLLARTPGVPAGHDASYGVDTSRDRNSTIVQRDAAGTHDIAGELMVYLVTHGAVPSMWLSPGGLWFSARDPGDPVQTLTVTVGNNGLADLRPTVSLAGAAPSGYTVVNDTCTGRAVRPNATCTFGVSFSTSAGGIYRADVVVSAPSVETESIEAIGMVYGTAPPVSAFTTADGATVPPGGAVTGTVSGNGPIDYEMVTFTPENTAVPTVSARVARSCDAIETSCTWTASTLLLYPGRYTVTAYGAVRDGHVESPGPAPISVLVL